MHTWNLDLHFHPIETLARVAHAVAGTVRAAERNLSAAREASAMVEFDQRIDEKRLRKLGYLK